MTDSTNPAAVQRTCPKCGSPDQLTRGVNKIQSDNFLFACSDPWHDTPSEPVSPPQGWTPGVEEARKYLMEKFSDRFSMDAIANAAYILAGEPVSPQEASPQTLDDPIWRATGIS